MDVKNQNLEVLLAKWSRLCGCVAAWTIQNQEVTGSDPGVAFLFLAFWIGTAKIFKQIDALVLQKIQK